MTQQTAAQQRAEEAGRWLATMPGGEAAPGEVGAALGLNHARQAETVRALRDAGWADGPKTTLRLTAAGWTRFGVVLEADDDAGPVLEDLLDGFPQSYRSFVALAVSALVARHHLSEAQPAGHLSLIAVGETGTGKSALFRLICDLFGWAYAEHELQTPMQTPGSLLGRRNEAGSGTGWVWEPATTTRLPFLLLDEVDKATDTVRRVAMVYAHGERRLRAEDQVHELHPTVMLAANPLPAPADRYGTFRPEYRRRSAVLDTGHMRARRGEIEALLTAHYARTDRPRLALHRLRPPTTLSPTAVDIIQSGTALLTEAGAEDFPGTRTLALAAQGRCALMGPDANDQAAAFATVLDYLHVTETVPGLVEPGWPARVPPIRQHFGASADAILAAIERAQQEREETARAVTRQRTQRQVRDLETVEAASRLAHECSALRDRLDGRRLATGSEDQRTQAAGLRKVLSGLSRSAAQVTNPAGLEEATALAEGPLSRGRALVLEVERDKAQRERDRADEAARVRQDRQIAADSAKRAAQQRRQAERDQRAYLREQLDQIVQEAQPLEAMYRRSTTRPDESPLAVLREHHVEGHPLLTWQPRTAPPTRGQPSRLSRLGDALVVVAGSGVAPPGAWVVAGSGLRLAGWRERCDALAEWGPGTRAVLAPLLAELHRAEDQCRYGLGVSGRRRPRVDVDQDVAQAGRLALTSSRRRLPQR